jgi:PhzF family phenazine biosynthesis protein
VADERDPLDRHRPRGDDVLEQQRQRAAVVRDAAAGVVADVDRGAAEVGGQPLAELLSALGWREDELDPALPPRVGFAGAHHPIVAAASRERLAGLDYDFARLRALMERRDWTTIQLVWREAPERFHARDPFPVGGVVEDPATGAAAAALGAYLRALGLVEPPARVTIHQGDDMGRPSVLLVDVPEGDASGIAVSGGAVPLPAGSAEAGT